MSTNVDKVADPILISPAYLSPPSLTAVIESFVQREGTDYGPTEISLEQKILNIRRRMEKKEIFLVFDPDTESITFLTSSEWQKFRNKNEVSL